MTTVTSQRKDVIAGRTCRIDFAKEANGYRFALWLIVDCRGGSVLVGEGWSAGTMYDAWDEARQTGNEKIPTLAARY